eukprot:4603487-Pleurochrysis_carterae.AAC.3
MDESKLRGSDPEKGAHKKSGMLVRSLWRDTEVKQCNRVYEIEQATVGTAPGQPNVRFERLSELSPN